MSRLKDWAILKERLSCLVKSPVRSNTACWRKSYNFQESRTDINKRRLSNTRMSLIVSLPYSLLSQCKTQPALCSDCVYKTFRFLNIYHKYSSEFSLFCHSHVCIANIWEPGTEICWFCSQRYSKRLRSKDSIRQRNELLLSQLNSLMHFCKLFIFSSRNTWFDSTD